MDERTRKTPGHHEQNRRSQKSDGRGIRIYHQALGHPAQLLVRWLTRDWLDNNWVENAIRPNALGRKNYLFAGSHEGAKRAAMFYSFFGTCKMNKVNPYHWLKKVLEVIPEYPANKLADLLPQNLML